MTFDEYLIAIGRPNLATKTPGLQIANAFYSWLCNRHGIENLPELKCVYSYVGETSLHNFKDHAYLVWDERYSTFINCLLHDLFMIPLGKCLAKTETAILERCGEFFLKRGLLEQAYSCFMACTPGRITNWTAILEAMWSSAQDNRGTKHGKGSTSLPYQTAAEFDVYVARSINLPRETLSGIAGMVQILNSEFVVAHEAAHHLLAKDNALQQHYRRRATKLVADPETWLETVQAEDDWHLGAPIYFGIREDGLQDQDQHQEGVKLFTRSVVENNLSRWLSSDAILTEVCCDLFAIDAILAYRAIQKTYPNGIAEVEMALWVGHQYTKWLAHIQIALLDEFEGVGNRNPDLVHEKTARGLMKLAHIRQILHESTTDSTKLLVIQHLRRLEWTRILFNAKQRFVFDAYANNEEYYRGRATGFITGEDISENLPILSKILTDFWQSNIGNRALAKTQPT